MDRVTAQQRLLQVLNKECWRVTFNPELERSVGLDLGGKRARRVRSERKRSANPDADLEGEFKLWIHCSWRLCSNDRVIISSGRSEDEAMIPEVETLKGIWIVQIDFGPYFWDIRLHLSDGRFIDGFSAQDLKDPSFCRSDIELEYAERELCLGPGNKCEETDAWTGN